jgi:hypothetical protein
VSDDSANPPIAAPPAASGPAGARFEGKVGAFYFLALLASGEPRGLPGATARAVRFQQSAQGRPLDDVTIDAINADGSKAFLDIQAKRTIDFTRGDDNFAAVVRQLWATSQKQNFETSRYEMAVAIARTSTRIERDCQQVLQWARRLSDGDSFAAHIQRAGLASKGMREFVHAFRHHLAATCAPTDDETIWRLLRRFQILVFDFEAPGSDYDHRARERGRTILAPDQTGRAADLWSILTDEALSYDAVGGEVDRAALVRDLGQKHDLRFGDRADLRLVHARLSEAADHAIADIKDSIGGARLSRAEATEEACQGLEQLRIVHISGAAGVGKSAVLKALVELQRGEGTVLVLAPGRIVGGGWLKMAPVIGCSVGLNELLNELGCGGGATLFVDNIDQIDDADAWLTLRDLLRGVLECPGWRAVFTVRSDNEEWRANLPDELRQLSFATVRVNPLSDSEADVLRAANPALSALLAPDHPARAMARNLFYLSRLMDLTAGETRTLVNETDLAKTWWRFGGGRSEAGRFERLKLLRSVGERVIRQPGIAAVSADELDSKTVEELLHVESLREDRAGATVAFWHDTLRDWTIGFLLDEKPGLREVLPTDRPVPGTIARGLEIAARLALASDTTGARWLSLLAAFEGEGCHGSWRRPVLMALPRSENAFELFERVEPALVADKGRRLKEIIQLMLAVETTPLAEFLGRAQNPPAISDTVAARMVMPSGSSWMPLATWLALRSDQLPSAIIPDTAKLFELWLVVAQAGAPELNQLIVQRLYEWLTRIEEADRPIVVTDISEAPHIDLDFDRMNDVHEEIRMTFLSFCHLNPQLAAKYLAETNPDHHHDARQILKYPGVAAKAAPAALADFALAVLIPKEDEDDLYRRRRDRFGPFGVFDTDFVSVSPGQGPFFSLLQESPQDGLRLVRGLVEHATQWNREWRAENDQDFPVLTISFPDGAKTFDGDFGTYQWTRGGTGALVAASALMALEAWAHRQIEAGRAAGEVLHNVLGPSGSSIAFVCVAVDLVLSHWSAMKEVAWPMLAVPKLLQYDHMRSTQDQTGLGRFFTQQQEPEDWPVKTADLLSRPSRGRELIDKAGDYALHGPADIQMKLRKALIEARDRVAEGTYQDDSDRIFGLRATAERALRMNHAEHWQPVTVRFTDGREVEALQYQIPPEEIVLRNAEVERSNGNISELSTRLSLQKALSEPEKSTPEIVAQGIAWAKGRLAESNADQPSDTDDHDIEWQERAVVMAAALAARDYEGRDRAAVEEWSCSVLQPAATEYNDDIASRASEQVYSNKTAIAAVGYAGLYRKNKDAMSRDALLALAALQDHAVLNAIGGNFREFARLDPRLPRALVRLVMWGAAHPRRTHEAGKDAKILEVHRENIAKAVDAERHWLDGLDVEPPWPVMAPWHSRRRRYIRLGGRTFEEEIETPRASPEMYVDEHALGILAGHLVGLTIDEVPEWLLSLASHFMTWTIEANNGPPGDDDEERENLPHAWNRGYFEFLGILSVAVPFDRARALFIEPTTRLHDDAFNDAAAAFLRGFDRSTRATDTPQPENPAGVRSLISERIQRTRSMRSLSYRDTSFTAETHLADALNAMFYQPPRFMNHGRADLPDRWDGLLETMPILALMVTSFPQSGYLTVVFLTLMENSPHAAFLPHMVEAVSAWRKIHAAGAIFWNEHQVGNRICEWIERTLNDDPDAANVLPQVRDELGKCLDVLVRSGVASARALEGRLAGDESKKSA